jgi:anti-sigma regulatory factor (Ser/Thr protein kinase)/Fe-S-cluster-containing hydrogenase component 2
MTAATYTIVGGDYEHGGAASRALKEQLKKVGADPAVVRRAMIAAYEAEMNVVIHAERGELRAELQSGQLDVEVVDEGPGIPDVEQAMRPGYSTASATARELGFGAGMGLPNIKKNSDQFAIESAVGRGTRVRFTILLKPQSLYGAGRHSLHIVAERCKQSLHCVRACPTRAVRVFRGRPEVLDYLCIDCTACIAACPTATLVMKGTVDVLPPAGDFVLVVTPESLVQFGAGVTPARVLSELGALGWRDVRTTADWDAALRAAVIDYAWAEAAARPVISPACPAVVNLIEMRFPSLIPQLAPFESAITALATDLRGQRAAFVVSCPCQRTALLAGEAEPKPELILPAALRAAVRPRVRSNTSSAGSPPAANGVPKTPGNQILRVTGVRHVLGVLEAIEDGLAGDVRAVEPWACDAGCFGSPLLAEDPYLARQRWVPPAGAPAAAQAIRRRRPFEPRKGLRLDSDMGKAIQKLAKIDKMTRALPGGDCAICGAPTCAALAEDIVLGRATPDACVRRPAGGATAPTTGSAPDQEKGP